MSFLFSTSPSPTDVGDVFWTQQPVAVLAVAMVCVVVVLGSLKRALFLIGALMQAAAAAAAAALGSVVVLVMVVVVAWAAVR
ncbi:hypothetical protein ABZS66_26035 [Dactylosporangium sp. NPDC005572]|uniref:hypothetical protein n=1 Tax=Dactylosporangium sp. NPDC005572 TaxID=3156889 RepID=UPI0033A7EE57